MVQFRRMEKVVKQTESTILIGHIVGSYRCLDDVEHLICQDIRSRFTWFAKASEVKRIDELSKVG